MPPTHWLTFPIIAMTLIGVAVGRYPGLRMNRASIAMVGATLLILTGTLTLDQAYAAVDMNTLTLLLAMMIVNANLRLAGFFRLVGSKVLRWARTPRQLLLLIVLASGVLSALFLNDTIVLMFTPLVIEITVGLKRDPIPYLVGLVTAANIGSAATIVGNPQNMIIGIHSAIPFLSFTRALAPASLAGLVIVWGTVTFVYRREFAPAKLPEHLEVPIHIYRPLLSKGLVASALMLVGFLAGMPISLAASGAAALLLVTRRLNPSRVFREVDFTLLVFFAGLFIVTGAIQVSGFSKQLFAVGQPLAQQGVATLTAVTVVLSNLVSNVPAVLMFSPLIPQVTEPHRAWLTLAMASTFAGNLTLLGSVANLLVAEVAREHGIELSFGEYLKAGLPITIASLAVGTFWLMGGIAFP